MKRYYLVANINLQRMSTELGVRRMGSGRGKRGGRGWQLQLWVFRSVSLLIWLTVLCICWGRTLAVKVLLKHWCLLKVLLRWVSPCCTPHASHWAGCKCCWAGTWYWVRTHTHWHTHIVHTFTEIGLVYPWIPPAQTLCTVHEHKYARMHTHTHTHTNILIHPPHTHTQSHTHTDTSPLPPHPPCLPTP